MNRTVLTLVLTALVLLISGSAFGQLSINKGFKLGLNVADLRTDAAEGQDITTKNGITAGAFLELDFLGPLAAQGEVLYTQKGAKVEDTDSNAESTLSLNYFEIPLLVKLQVPVAPGLVSSDFYGGPALAFKLNENVEVDGQDVETEGDSFKSSDLGAVVGANLHFSTAGLLSFFIDLRYTMGLSDIAEEQVDGNNNSVKNGVITLSAGLGF